MISELSGLAAAMPRVPIAELQSGQAVDTYFVCSEKTTATDRNGNILVFNTTSRFFTLFGMAEFLKASQFNIDSALNLDGGTEAQLFIKTKDFEFYSPPSWENSIGNIIDKQKFWLPTVVGVFPRQD